MSGEHRMIEYSSVMSFGVCPACNVIYKHRKHGGERSEDEHRCHNCNEVVPLIKPKNKPSIFDD